LYQFKAGNDGTQPYGGVTIDTKRKALYGTTSEDGSFAAGTVYKLTEHGESVLYSFTGTGGDGEYPSYPGYLALDASGNLYGATTAGGNYGIGCGSIGCGVVFKVEQTGEEIILHEFSGAPDGVNPAGSLAIDASGSVYGTTYLGGTYGLGTVFKVDSSGNETVLYSFNPGVGDGYEPFSGLVRDAAGNLYGATLVGGTNGLGTVFEINTSGTETVIHNFPSNSQDGAEPWAGLVLDGKGNLYGTTYQGGADNYGTVFKISRAGTETVLYSFGPPPDGEGPTYGNNVIVDSAGNLYGMTASGGAYGLGTIYKIDANGNETVLHSFSGPDGRAPYSGLAFDPAGNLYGTTSAGGAYGGGVIFRITP
jgi:uncharacterized repeat protein (TIGR03803 family)